MNLEELDANINQPEKTVEVSNADVLASLVLIQSQIRKIEKLVAENQTINQKYIADIKATLATNDKNISAIPVLAANIISEKVNNVAAEINSSTDNIATAAKALNESNTAFKTFLQAWVGSMVICLIVVIGLIIWWR